MSLPTQPREQRERHRFFRLSWETELFTGRNRDAERLKTFSKQLHQSQVAGASTRDYVVRRNGQRRVLP